MKKTLLASALLVLGMAAHAADAQTVGSRLKEAFPQIPEVQSVNPTPIPGLKEVTLPGEIVYVDDKAEYMIQGHLIRLRDRSDLTTARLEDINRIDFKILPLDKAIVHKFGMGEKKLVVFADPNCTFCKKLEVETLPEVKNATVYTLPFAILSADSEAKSKQILCSAKPAEAWSAWMLKGTAPSTTIDSKCEAAAAASLAANLALGKKHGVTGTPTIFFEDGTRIPGFVPASTLNARLAETKPAAR